MANNHNSHKNNNSNNNSITNLEISSKLHTKARADMYLLLASIEVIQVLRGAMGLNKPIVMSGILAHMYTHTNGRTVKVISRGRLATRNKKIYSTKKNTY